MSCRACPADVAWFQLSEAARVLLPESAALCPDHMKLLIKRRREEREHAVRDAARLFCSCGNEMYLPGRAVCARCSAPATPTVNRTTDITPVSHRIPEDHYRSRPCHEEGCASKMVYFYPRYGVAMCDKHGAAPEPEGAHA